MERIVLIEGLGINGVRLNVTFTGQKTLAWPHLNVPFSSYGPGEGNTFVRVTSPSFADVEEARVWLDELTREVLALAVIQEETLWKFKQLEGKDKLFIL